MLDTSIDNYESSDFKESHRFGFWLYLVNLIKLFVALDTYILKLQGACFKIHKKK